MNKKTYTTRLPLLYTSTRTQRYVHTLLRGLQQFWHTTTAVGVLVFMTCKCRQHHVLKYIGAAQTMFCRLSSNRSRKKTEAARLRTSQIDLSREHHEDIRSGVQFTAVGLLNRNLFSSSEQHLLRCSVWSFTPRERLLGP